MKDQPLILTFTCPACGKESTHPVFNECKRDGPGEPLKVATCEHCHEVLLSEDGTNKFTVLTAKQFVLKLPFDIAMHVAGKIQKAHGYTYTPKTKERNI